VVSESWLAS